MFAPQAYVREKRLAAREFASDEASSDKSFFSESQHDKVKKKQKKPKPKSKLNPTGVRLGRGVFRQLFFF